MHPSPPPRARTPFAGGEPPRLASGALSWGARPPGMGGPGGNAISPFLPWLERVSKGLSPARGVTGQLPQALGQAAGFRAGATALTRDMACPADWPDKSPGWERGPQAQSGPQGEQARVHCGEQQPLSSWFQTSEVAEGNGLRVRWGADGHREGRAGPCRHPDGT